MASFKRYLVYFYCRVTRIYYEEYTNTPFELLEAYGFDLTLADCDPHDYFIDLEERDENGNGY